MNRWLAVITKDIRLVNWKKFIILLIGMTCFFIYLSYYVEQSENHYIHSLMSDKVFHYGSLTLIASLSFACFISTSEQDETIHIYKSLIAARISLLKLLIPRCIVSLLFSFISVLVSLLLNAYYQVNTTVLLTYIGAFHLLLVSLYMLCYLMFIKEYFNWILSTFLAFLPFVIIQFDSLKVLVISVVILVICVIILIRFHERIFALQIMRETTNQSKQNLLAVIFFVDHVNHIIDQFISFLSKRTTNYQFTAIYSVMLKKLILIVPQLVMIIILTIFLPSSFKVVGLVFYSVFVLQQIQQIYQFNLRIHNLMISLVNAKRIYFICIYSLSLILLVPMLLLTYTGILPFLFQLFISPLFVFIGITILSKISFTNI